MTFQEIIFALQKYWSSKGCVLGNPYDIEKGAEHLTQIHSLCH